ncbi:MAG: T9SS type A sorting domain-containing protein [Candidatus Marinimicrobia bacterium]|nr:T9SS type A sorting domain-containing protein [Candidatus Neomarinimicrobiota bacterium]
MDKRLCLIVIMVLLIWFESVLGHESWNTTLVGYCGPDTSLDVDINGSYAYVVDGSRGLHILDISDPTISAEIGFCSISGWAWDVTLEGNYAYVLTENSGLRIIDVSDPTSPTESGFIDVDSIQAMALEGDYTYLVFDSLLITVNISDPSGPGELVYHNFPPDHDELDILGVNVSGNYIYVSFYFCMLVLDMSDPTDPEEVQHLSGYDLYSFDKCVALSSTHAYMTYKSDLGGSCSFLSIDINDPVNASILESIELDSLYYKPDDIAVSDNYAYVLNTWDGLRIIDISAPSIPVDCGSYNSDSGPYNPDNRSRVAISGEHIFVAGGVEGTDGPGGVYIIRNDLAVVTSDEAYSIPQFYSLEQNYPNPFNPVTSIRYDLPEQSTVSLIIYDIRGHEMVTLGNAEKPPGNYNVQWNGRDELGKQLSTGVYFCRMAAGNFSQTIKMVYLR